MSDDFLSKKYFEKYYINKLHTNLELLDQDLLRALVDADKLALARGDDAGAVRRVVHAGEVLAVVGVGGGHHVVRPSPS